MVKRLKATFRVAYISIKMLFFGYSEYRKMEIALESLIISVELSINRTYQISEQVKIAEGYQLELVLEKLKPIIVKDFLMHIQLINGGHDKINKSIRSLEKRGEMVTI